MRFGVTEGSCGHFIDGLGRKAQIDDERYMAG